ncbi:MAG TPA: MlaD family protein [Burkholderiaceae bacterium]|nr:MlaD family protein [Burkholderiaceae bacterium]
MENKAHAMAAGIFVLVVSALLAALAVWLTRDQGERHLYEISTQETVSGLQPQAAVRYRGVDVGKVVFIGFDPAAKGNILLRLAVDSEAPMTQATVAKLGYQGVTGLAFIQLDDGGQPAPALVPDDAHPPRIPLKDGLFGTLLNQGTAIMEKVGEVTTRMNQLMNDDNQKRLATALDNIGQAAAGVNQLATRLDGTTRQRLDPALVALQEMAGETTKTMRSMGASADSVAKTSAEVGKTAQRLNEKDGPIDRLAEGTEALSHAADSFNAATLPRINRVTDETSRAARQLSRTVNAINDNPQSLLFGSGAASPGPGEPGFLAPGASK